jgi:hypothetical protein
VAVGYYFIFKKKQFFKMDMKRFYNDKEWNLIKGNGVRNKLAHFFD